MPDLLGGHVAIMFGSTSVVPHAKAGKLVPLGVTGVARSRALPQTPTIAESGLPGYDVTSWNALFAPAGTSEAIIKRLNALVREALVQPDVVAMLQKQDLEVVPGTPDELAKLMRAELAKWAKVIRAAGIKPI
jgi:tripartite-type tricarboxylate transporter receptor subunit TctC